MRHHEPAEYAAHLKEYAFRLIYVVLDYHRLPTTLLHFAKKAFSALYLTIKLNLCIAYHITSDVLPESITSYEKQSGLTLSLQACSHNRAPFPNIVENDQHPGDFLDGTQLQKA